MTGEEAMRLHDRAAELHLMAAALRDPVPVLAAASEVGFEAADLYHDDLRALFDAVAFVANGPHEPCPLVEVYLELRRRRAGAGAAYRLAGVFTADGYYDREGDYEREMKLASDATRGRSYEEWVAGRAAERVRHLAARRRAAAAAEELMREALYPSGPAEEIEDGIDRHWGGV